jgi:hypothetical protein
MPEITAQFAAYPNAHAMKHKLAPDGREALAHMLMLPDQGIAGFIYPSFHADGPGKARAKLFGPGLDVPIEEDVEAAYPADMDFDDCSLGSLHMAIREPHRTIDLAWRGERLQFEGRYEALHPPYAFSQHPDGVPPYYGDDRTEQHGRIAADFTVDGRSFRHAGFMAHDHSWGPRVWGLNQHYKWVHLITANTSIHFFEMQSFGRVHVCGYLWKDGRMRHLAEVKYDIVYDETMWQKEFNVRAIDTDGRTVDVACQMFAKTQLCWTPEVYLNEAAVTLEMDGQTGTGWVEFCWNREYFDFARQHVTRFGATAPRTVTNG